MKTGKKQDLEKTIRKELKKGLDQQAIFNLLREKGNNKDKLFDLLSKYPTLQKERSIRS